jgi:hypothetical protein
MSPCEFVAVYRHLQANGDAQFVEHALDSYEWSLECLLSTILYPVHDVALTAARQLARLVAREPTSLMQVHRWLINGLDGAYRVPDIVLKDALSQWFPLDTSDGCTIVEKVLTVPKPHYSNKLYQVIVDEAARTDIGIGRMIAWACTNHLFAMALVTRTANQLEAPTDEAATQDTLLTLEQLARALTANPLAFELAVSRIAVFVDTIQPQVYAANTPLLSTIFETLGTFVRDMLPLADITDRAALALTQIAFWTGNPTCIDALLMYLDQALVPRIRYTVCIALGAIYTQRDDVVYALIDIGTAEEMRPKMRLSAVQALAGNPLPQTNVARQHMVEFVRLLLPDAPDDLRASLLILCDSQHLWCQLAKNPPPLSLEEWMPRVQVYPSLWLTALSEAHTADALSDLLDALCAIPVKYHDRFQQALQICYDQIKVQEAIEAMPEHRFDAVEAQGLDKETLQKKRVSLHQQLSKAQNRHTREVARLVALETEGQTVERRIERLEATLSVASQDWDANHTQIRFQQTELRYTRKRLHRNIDGQASDPSEILLALQEHAVRLEHAVVASQERMNQLQERIRCRCEQLLDYKTNIDAHSQERAVLIQRVGILTTEIEYIVSQIQLHIYFTALVTRLQELDDAYHRAIAELHLDIEALRAVEEKRDQDQEIRIQHNFEMRLSKLKGTAS